MHIPPGELFATRFRRVLRDDVGKFSLDSHMLAVFMEMDGERTLREVAHKVGMEPSSVAGVVAKLSDLRLIEPVQITVSPVDAAFMRDLIAEFSLAIGPVADVVVEDTVMELGYDLSSFPSNRTAELVELLARELQREGDKLTFKKNMLEKIKRTGY